MKLRPRVTRVSPPRTAAAIRPCKGKNLKSRRTIRARTNKHPHPDRQTRAAPEGDQFKDRGPHTARRRRPAAATLPPCLRHRLRGAVRPSPHEAAKTRAPGHSAKGITAPRDTDALGSPKRPDRGGGTRRTNPLPVATAQAGNGRPPPCPGRPVAARLEDSRTTPGTTSGQARSVRRARGRPAHAPAGDQGADRGPPLAAGSRRRRRGRGGWGWGRWGLGRSAPRL